jgi:hypothetical protein
MRRVVWLFVLPPLIFINILDNLHALVGLIVTQEKKMVIHFTTYILLITQHPNSIKQNNTLKSIPSVKQNNNKINSISTQNNYMQNELRTPVLPLVV